MNNKPFPPSEELKSLPIMAPPQIMDYFSKKRGAGEDPGRVLLEARHLIDLLEVVGGFKIGLRALATYSSERLKLIPPPITKERHGTCYVFPDHFDLMMMILTLRQGYHLPLEKIQRLLEHFPAEQRHLIIERKLSLEDSLDLAKMLSRGFGIKDLVMAKACDSMLQDLMPPIKAITLAMEPGEALADKEEQLILERLEEIKTWVSTGRRREFLHRESAEDFRDLASHQLLGKKISRKIMARHERRLRKKSAGNQ